MKKGKLYLGILFALVMAALVAVPALAAEDVDAASSDVTAEDAALTPAENVGGGMDSLYVSANTDGDEPDTNGSEPGSVEEDSIPVTGISLNQKSATVNIKGQTLQLVATVAPSYATDPSLTWKSDKESAATVTWDADDPTVATVTAVANGTATITVTSNENDEISASCTITVSLYSDGFHQDPDTGEWYYYENGVVSTGTTDVMKGKLNGTSGWWNVVKGKVVGNTVAKNSNGWWYIDASGMVDFSYNGFAKNGNGSWYCENGKVTFSKQDIIKDTIGALGKKNAWYYVIRSKVQTDFTGLSNFRNSHGWWYIKKGKVDFTHNGVDKNKNGWWYVTGGKVQLGFTGLANYRNTNGWWYIKKGKVDFSHNGVDKNKNGWYYVVGGKVDFSYTGVSNYKNSHGWWYLKKGKVDFTANTVAKNKNGWWYVKNGKVDFSYTGSAKNSNGWWYCKGGKVDFNVGTVVKNGSDWVYYYKGKRNSSYSGVAANENGWWYVHKGKVLFDDALTYAARFVGANTSSSQSNRSKLSTCFRVLWSTYPYVRTYGDNPSPSVISQYAIDMFKNKKGNCFRYAASFTCIAKVLGYDARFAHGMISSASGGMTPHGWTEVYNNGQWLICDPDMQMNHPNINSYMRTESNYAYQHTCSARYTLTVTDSGVVWK